MSAPRIKVTGDEAVARGLAEFGRDVHREIDEASRRVASQQAEDARGAAYSIGGVAAHVAPTIAAQGESATFGGGMPMAMGAEFGRDAYAQFRGWTGSGEGAGYFFVPTIKASEADRLREYENAVDAAVRGFAR